ncbi:unnamed protein product [Porites lobata]|uniref:RING-type E3 ubiquitin transferase n=1 Tax=Porites lobata TaxID=104759 RepID=A0ABN8R359_9CNID|nr:unnamed protein product [Porites lobata]
MMPSNPRKAHGVREDMSRKTTKRSDSDGDDSDGLPPLLPCTSDEEEDDVEEYSKKPANKAKVKGKEASNKSKSDAECADIWYKLKKEDKEKHIHVMKVYLLSPFLFGIVHQDDKWIKWAFESKLLPSKSSFETRELEEKYFDAVDLIETAFNRLAETALLKNKDGLVKILNLIGSPGVSMSQHLDKAVTCAESFLAFTNLRDKIKLKPGITKRQGDVALLLAHYQVTDHIKQLASGTDLVEDFTQKCKKEEANTTDDKNAGNAKFEDGKYTAASSIYTKALHMSPYNHLLYGNRAQSFLKTKDLRRALSDGRRAVVLKPDWHKAQYRYAQAFYELGDITRAKETNRAARKICSEKKDLEGQFERFEKGFQATKEGKGKATEKRKAAKHSKLLDDLPDLVDPDSGDTSSDDDNGACIPDLVDMEDEDSTDSTHDDSEDPNSDISGYESDDSSARKKNTSAAPLRKKKRPNKKVRQALRETMQNKVKREEKAKKEEEEKKVATGKENKKLEKKNKKAKATQVDQNGNSQRKKEFTALLKQGSKAVLEKKCVMAVHNYGKAITILEQYDFCYQVFDLKEIDFVILLYGFGAAYLEVGGHEELREAKKQFDIIVVEHKNVVFPLAYLGSGRVFYKQNRFTEALKPLEEGLALVNKLGDDLASYRWPGSQVIIDETKPGKLQSAIETLIRICRHPPRPDAVCRYQNCSNKAQIYLTDPDYKGYIQLICHQECKVEFHPVCWKKQKSTQEGKAGDKDFLDDGCLTPDCGGSVVNIQIFDTDGLKTEFKSEKLNTKQENKPKATKQNKVKGSVVATKQKKKKEKEDAIKIEDVTPTDTDTTEEKEPSNPAPHQPPPPPPPPSVPVQKEEKPPEEKHPKNALQDNSNADAGIGEGGGGFILKKDEDEEPIKGVGKAKTRKKKAKNTQTLDEFLKDRGGQQTFRPGFGETVDEVDEITIPKGKFEFVPPPPGWSQHEMEAPFAIPPHLQGDVAQLEASYAGGLNTMFSFSPVTAPPPQIDLKAVTDYVSTMLQEILRANGPLELADPNIMQPLSMLPDNYQDIISNAGGLRPILEQSGKFVFDGNRVMLPEDKDFEELVQDLKPSTNNPFLERISESDSDTRNLENAIQDAKAIWDADSVMETDEFAGELNFSSSSSQLSHTLSSPPFNPEAKEFVPSSSQTLLDNSSSKTSLVSNGSNVKDVELVDDQIAEEGNTNIQESESVENCTEEHRPDSNGVEDDKTVSSDAGENKSVLNGSEEQKPVLSDAEELKAFSNGNEELKPFSNGSEELKPISNGTEETRPISNVTEELTRVSNGVEEQKPVSNSITEQKPDSESTKDFELVGKRSEAGPIVDSYDNDVKTIGGTEKQNENALTDNDEVAKNEPVAVGRKNSDDSSGNMSRVTFTVEQAGKNVVPEIAGPKVQSTHKRTGSNNSSSSEQSVITSKTKSVQTQPNVKHKGVGTDPIPEPFKAEYQRTLAEKDSLQARLQETTERHNALLSKNSAEVEKVKKKLADALQDKEKYYKEVQDIKQKNSEEIRKLRQQCEDKEEKIKLLNQKMLQSTDDKTSAVNNLKKELATCKGQFSAEKDSWNKERSEKEDLLKNMKVQHQQQQTRAQDAEIKLLELRRDVGLRFLERAYQESHITINNLLQAVNARIAGPKVEELINTWKNYAAECHQRILQCKTTFNEQIEQLKTGRTLASVPQLTIPGPPPYPAIPVLQSVVPGQQQQQQNQQQQQHQPQTQPQPQLQPHPSHSPLWKTRLHFPERLTLPSLMYLLVLLAQSRVPPQLDLFLAILMLLLAEIKLPLLPLPLWLTKQDLPTALKKLCYVYPPCIRILPVWN